MPKLTLRDLFVAMTIVTLALGWWVDRSRLVRQIDQLRTQAKLHQALRPYSYLWGHGPPHLDKHP